MMMHNQRFLQFSGFWKSISSAQKSQPGMTNKYAAVPSDAGALEVHYTTFISQEPMLQFATAYQHGPNGSTVKARPDLSQAQKRLCAPHSDATTSCSEQQTASRQLEMCYRLAVAPDDG